MSTEIARSRAVAAVKKTCAMGKTKCERLLEVGNQAAAGKTKGGLPGWTWPRRWPCVRTVKKTKKKNEGRNRAAGPKKRTYHKKGGRLSNCLWAQPLTTQSMKMPVAGGSRNPNAGNEPAGRGGGAPRKRCCKNVHGGQKRVGTKEQSRHSGTRKVQTRST